MEIQEKMNLCYKSHIMSSLRIDPLSSGVEVREKTRNRRRKRRAGHQRCHSVPFRGTALTT